MSFLLDALRKSENQKHLGSTPTIHSSSVLETRTSANRRLGLVLVVLLPVLLVLAWFSFRDLLPGAMPADLIKERPEVAQLPSPAKATIKDTQADNQPLQEIPTATVENTRLDASRTPVETYSASQETQGGKLPQPARSEPPDSEMMARESAPDQSNVSALPVKPIAAPLEQMQPESKPVKQEPALISYWEIPESTRSQLADMRISVMVYSEKPAERFILMNGKRLVVGDEPQAGLVLEEIRREGAVFSFRLYRFLVKR